MSTRGGCQDIEWKLEGLLAYAVRHGDEVEASRIRAELQKLISGL